MEKQFKVDEIYQLLGQLNGLTQTDPKTQEQITILTGFINEKSISEGIRRIANKTAKKLNENYPLEQLKSIQLLTEKDLNFPENSDITKEQIDLKLAELKKSKLESLVNDEVTINFEELPDFKILEKQLDERKANLSHNYTFLFEKLFLNY